MQQVDLLYFISLIFQEKRKFFTSKQKLNLMFNQILHVHNERRNSSSSCIFNASYQRGMSSRRPFFVKCISSLEKTSAMLMQVKFWNIRRDMLISRICI